MYTGSIQTAGSVKGKSSAKHAVSDWMDIEKERGISVTSSVLQFEYDGHCVQHPRHPGPPGLLGGYLPHPHGRRRRRHGHRRRKGRRGPDHQALQGLHASPHPDLHLREQARPRRARPLRAHGGDRERPGHQHLPHELAHRFGPQLPRRLRPPVPPRARLRGRRPRQRHKEGPRDRGRARQRHARGAHRAREPQQPDGRHRASGRRRRRARPRRRGLRQALARLLRLRAHELRRRALPPGLPSPHVPSARLHRQAHGRARRPGRERLQRLCVQDPGEHGQEPPRPHRLRAHLLGQVRARHERLPHAGRAQPQARRGHLDDGRRPRHRGRGVRRRHRWPL